MNPKSRRNASFILSPISARVQPVGTFGYMRISSWCPASSSWYAFGGSMFTILRSVLIIGVIFYFSPERQAGTGSADGGTGGDERNQDLPVAIDGKAEATWRRMAVAVTEEAVRTAVQDKVEAAGFRLKEYTPRSSPEGMTKSLAAKDGPRPREAEPKALLGPGIRCVYRCDGTE
jgi:hypothetical protein